MPSDLQKGSLVKNDSRNVIWNIIGTSLNALISLALMIIVTRVNGEDTAGVYAFSFSVALVFYFIGVYHGRVYQVSDTSDLTDGDFLLSRTVTCLCMMMTATVFVLLNHYDLYKSACILIFCLYKCMEAFTESIYAVIQRNNELYKVGISSAVKSIAVTAVFYFIDRNTHDLMLSAGGITVTYLLVFLIYDLRNLRLIDTDLDTLCSRRYYLYREGFFPFIISILSACVINTSKYVIDLKLTNVDQAIYGIIIMPSTLILLFVQYILHPYIGRISHLYKEGAYPQIGVIVRRFMMAVGGVGIIATAVAAAVGIPVLELIYGIRLHDYRLHLVIIMLGAGLFGISNILSNVLITIRENRIQSAILFAASMIAFALAYFLTPVYGLMGAASSYTIVMFILFVSFTALMFTRLKETG